MYVVERYCAKHKTGLDISYSEAVLCLRLFYLEYKEAGQETSPFFEESRVKRRKSRGSLLTVYTGNNFKGRGIGLLSDFRLMFSEGTTV